MGFWLLLFLFIGSSILANSLRPKNINSDPSPSSLGDFSFPTAEEGRCIPIAWGTVHVKGGNVTWYGNLTVETLTKRVGNWISHQDVVTGYHYYLGVQYCLCYGPIDAIVDVQFDDRSPGYTKVSGAENDVLTFNNWGFFGGDDKEGGIAGTMVVWKGTNTQGADSYLQSVIGCSLPGYRGVCYAVLRGMYLGTSAYIKPLSITFRRCPNQLGVPSGHERIGEDANPACALYELLTEPRWGLGLPSGSVDLTSFRAAAETLFTEGVGISMIVDSQSPGNKLAEEILRHIDAVLFTDPFTGVLTLKLVRADYVKSALPLFNESNADGVEFSRPSWAETKNYIRVKFIDRANAYMSRIAFECNLANVQVRGGVMAIQEMDYKGFSTAALAQRVAARDLKTLSYPVATIRLNVNRTGWSLRPGSAFRLTWPTLGISEMVCRVTGLTGGDLNDGKVVVEAVEDIFNVTWTSNVDPGGGGWIDPRSLPTPLAFQRLEEMPYTVAGGNLRYVMTFASHGSGTARGYEVWSDPLNGTNFDKTEDVPVFSPTAQLVSNIAELDTSFNVYNGLDFTMVPSVKTGTENRSGSNLLIVDNEIIAFESCTDNGDGTFTIAGARRGALDSAPRAHLANARAWYLSAGRTDANAYGADVVVNVKMLPYNDSGVVTLANATAINKSTSSRASRPYCPCNLKMGGASYPATITGTVTVSWDHRNRLDTGWSYASPPGMTNAIEAGCQYRIQWRNGAGTVVREVTTTGKTDIYTPATGTGWTVRVYCEVISGGLLSQDYLLWTGAVV
jgi:hypothetical protein